LVSWPKSYANQPSSLAFALDNCDARARKAAFDDAIRTWGQLIGVRTLEDAVAIQSDYAKRTYENHMAELKKLGEMCVGMVRDASRPVEDASRKLR